MRRLLSTLVIGVSLMVAAVTPAAAQYGEDPPQVTVIGAGVANASGEFRASYTAPDEIDQPYLIYVVGVDDEGEPFEFVVANVTPAFAGLSWTLNGIDMQPGSEYRLEARHEASTDVGPGLLDIEALPVTGGETRTILGIGAILAVVGLSVLYASRLERRSAPVA